jgi:hypothetical protein
MSENLSPSAKQALDLFQDSLTKLVLLRNSNPEEPQFIKWHSATTEIFRRFLPESNYRAGFLHTSFQSLGHFDQSYPKSDEHHPYNRGCGAARAYIENAIEHIQKFGLDNSYTDSGSGALSNSHDGVSILISHSSKDKKLAESLANLLRTGLQLSATQIRCTSVDGYRLPGGANTNEVLRDEIKRVPILVALLTRNSLASTYVLFELGARWAFNLPMIPLLAGIDASEMRGPDNALNALSCETDGQLIQLVEDVGKSLQVAHQSAASYQSQIQDLRSLAQSTLTSRKAQTPENATLERQVGELENQVTALSKKPYNETLQKKAEILISELNAKGKLLLRHLLENEPLEVGRQFFASISSEDEYYQMKIAMSSGIVRHQEVRVGSGHLLRTEYVINPQYRPVLQDLLYRA